MEMGKRYFWEYCEKVRCKNFIWKWQWIILWRNQFISCHCTAQKMKFSSKNFFCKCDQIRSKLRIWLHLLKKSLMENLRWKTCDGKHGKPGNSVRKVLTNSLKVEVTKTLKVNWFALQINWLVSIWCKLWRLTS